MPYDIPSCARELGVILMGESATRRIKGPAGVLDAGVRAAIAVQRDAIIAPL